MYNLELLGLACTTNSPYHSPRDSMGEKQRRIHGWISVLRARNQILVSKIPYRYSKILKTRFFQSAHQARPEYGNISLSVSSWGENKQEAVEIWYYSVQLGLVHWILYIVMQRKRDMDGSAVSEQFKARFLMCRIQCLPKFMFKFKYLFKFICLSSGLNQLSFPDWHEFDSSFYASRPVDKTPQSVNTISLIHISNF